MAQGYRFLREESIVPLPVALWRNIKKNPLKTVLEFRGAEFSYEELGRQVSLFSSIISTLTKNVEGEVPRVALFLPNLPQFVFAYYGAILARRQVIPVSYLSIVAELRSKKVKDIAIGPRIRKQFETGKPHLIIASDNFWPLVEQLDSKVTRGATILMTSPGEYLPTIKKVFYPLYAKKRGWTVDIPKRDGVVRLEDLLCHKRKDSLDKFTDYENNPPKLDEAVQLQYTTGTTGSPKAAELTHRNLIANVLQCREHFRGVLWGGEAVLGSLPFCHIYGITACLNSSILSLSGKLVLLPEFSQKAILELIDKHKVDLFPASSRMLKLIYNSPEFQSYSGYIPIISTSGASKLDENVFCGFSKRGWGIYEGFGMTETSPIITIAKPGAVKIGSVGRPLPGTMVRVVDPRTEKDLPCGEKGEVLARGPQVMRGYWNNREETEKVIRDGWLHTGDVGMADEDGDLRIVGRIKNTIKVNDQLVSGEEIEEYLKEYQGIKNCAVIAAPYAKTGEAPIAFVVRGEGFREEELARHAADVPEKLWRLFQIIEVEEKTFSCWVNESLGKVEHEAIRQYYSENHNHKVIYGAGR